MTTFANYRFQSQNSQCNSLSLKVSGPYLFLASAELIAGLQDFVMNAGRKTFEMAGKGSAAVWEGYGNDIPNGPENEDDEFIDGVSRLGRASLTILMIRIKIVILRGSQKLQSANCPWKLRAWPTAVVPISKISICRSGQ